MKTLIGTSSQYPDPKKNPGIKRGYSYWIENGEWFTAPKVNAKKFGKHAYENGGYEMGIRDCPCGCFMLSYRSGGPVDPNGPCPKNPKY